MTHDARTGHQETTPALVAFIARKSHLLERVGGARGNGDSKSNEDDDTSGVMF